MTKYSLPRRAQLAGIVLTLGLGYTGVLRAAEQIDFPEPLPPPPELLENAGATPGLPDPVAEALRPVAVLADSPETSLNATYSEPEVVIYNTTFDPGPGMSQGDTALVRRGPPPSPESGTNPDYFELPAGDASIPGVLLPELADDPGQVVASPTGFRQPDTFFALAKGSEGAALEARERRDDSTYYSQLEKSRQAYLDIIGMADAGGEAREEAWYGVARCEYRLGNWWRSFEALERSFPREFLPAEVERRLQLEMFVAERLWRYGNSPITEARVAGRGLDGYQAAARVYAAVVHNAPIGAEAPLALLRQGDAAGFRSDWEDAARHYRRLIEYYPDSEESLQARSSLAETIYRREWPTGLPEAARNDANLVMEDVEGHTESLSPEARERRERAVAVANQRERELKLRQAKDYLRLVRLRKSREGAVFILRDVVALYPGTEEATEAGEILLSLGETLPEELSGERSPFTTATATTTTSVAPAGTTTLTATPEGDVLWDGSNYSPPAALVTLGEGDYSLLPPSPSRETIYQSPILEQVE
ncbi:MAG: tetratricopeptide repeat protein [Planctomycetota bacterium]|nr:tetratricopeptide repeat protein [Planctomycetota bacterium]